MTPLEGDVTPWPRLGGAAHIKGDFKLIVGNISQSSWEGPKYPNGTDGDDAWNTWLTVEQCSPPGGKLGCLFNIIEDPTEHNDLALAMPEKAREIYARMEELQKTFFDPPRGEEELDAACAAVAARGGFWGPWRGDNSSLELDDDEL